MDSSKRLVSQKKREPRLAVRAVKGTLFSTEGGREGGQRQNLISELKKDRVFQKKKPFVLIFATSWLFLCKMFSILFNDHLFQLMTGKKLCLSIN